MSSGTCTHCDYDIGVPNHFIDHYIHDCVYSVRDWIGFALQMVSVLSWIFAQVPQFIDNWRNESAEALSPWFLAEWFLGDATNLIGCLLTGTQLPLTTGTAFYFIACDITMMLQYTLYAAKARRRERRAQAEAKRERIASLGREARQLRQAYEQQQSSPRHDVAFSERRLVGMHSSPNLGLMQDVGWAVHALDVPRTSTDAAETAECVAASSSSHGDEGGVAADAADSVVPCKEACSRDGVPRSGLVAPHPVSGPDKRVWAALSGPTMLFVGTSMLLCVAALFAMFGTEPDPDGSWHSRALQAVQEAPVGFTQRLGSFVATGNWQSPTHPSELGGGLARTSPPPSGQEPHCPVVETLHWEQTLGLYLGYVSAIAYLKSRVSQIVKNLSHSEVGGLAVGMFVCAIIGNVTGALGIMIRLRSVTQIVWQLPWMVGMAGTVLMDVVIALQALSAKKAVSSPTSQRLLVDGLHTDVHVNVDLGRSPRVESNRAEAVAGGSGTRADPPTSSSLTCGAVA